MVEANRIQQSANAVHVHTRHRFRSVLFLSSNQMVARMKSYPRKCVRRTKEFRSSPVISSKNMKGKGKS